MSYIYIIEANDEYKIGHSKHPQKRLKELQTAHGTELNIIFQFETKYGFKLEKAIHRFMSPNNKKGEVFTLTNEDISNIKKLCINIENSFDFNNTI